MPLAGMRGLTADRDDLTSQHSDAAGWRGFDSGRDKLLSAVNCLDHCRQHHRVIHSVERT